MHKIGIIKPFIDHCCYEGTIIWFLCIGYVNLLSSIFLATCSDGKKNQNETGVDCGGVCPACRKIQSFFTFIEIW